jgi:hypothetical protein
MPPIRLPLGEGVQQGEGLLGDAVLRGAGGSGQCRADGRSQCVGHAALSVGGARCDRGVWSEGRYRGMACTATIPGLPPVRLCVASNSRALGSVIPVRRLRGVAGLVEASQRIALLRVAGERQSPWSGDQGLVWEQGGAQWLALAYHSVSACCITLSSLIVTGLPALTASQMRALRSRIDHIAASNVGLPSS